MIQRQLEDNISLSVLIQLSLTTTDTTLLTGWGSAYVTLAVLPSAKYTAPESSGNTFPSLLRLLKTRKPSRQAGIELPAFITGLIGHMTYEVAELLEPSLQLPKAQHLVSNMQFNAYDASVSWHRSSGKTYIFACTEQAADRLQDWLTAIILAEVKYSGNAKEAVTLKPAASVSEIEFKAAVESIRQRILAGDFFQANLTRMLSVDLGDTTRIQLASFAERFLSQSQAPFGAILNFEDATVVSASPERFFRIEPTPEGRRIFAEPIKGTRPRHQDPVLDEKLKQDLLSSEKDRAENIMIADLVRNDLSRVCTDESIVADPVCELKTFKNVHHLVTRISGMLREDVSNLDALLAQFPCGSITGAPKWAAMDAIAEIEQRGRGIYCGTIGYFDDRGHADFSVAIRTAVASFSESGTTLTYGTGGGITVLSDPEEEFTETEDKAAGFLRALQP